MGKDPDVHMQEVADDFKKIDKLQLTIEADPRLNLKGDSTLSAKSEEETAGKQAEG
jgi:hypothetical protein